MLYGETSARSGIADAFYSLSYLYYGPLGTFSTIITGLIVSHLTGPTKREALAYGLLWRDLATVPTIKSTEMPPEADKTNLKFPNAENNHFILKANPAAQQRKGPRRLGENACFTFWPTNKVARESCI
ncbi:hypothetical protein GDO78_020889 [Eleutherodactylus coqui]|uniref:Uncharacterized protein n=1 Tax=Eleutherodactylus coqui TaxID=57060 RepID=A0A8J6B653_ELECQ|nr:hypothetical protein GDO78_020889 [Eleutherodactylus coqui]